MLQIINFSFVSRMILITYHPWEKNVTGFCFILHSVVQMELQSYRSNFSRKEPPSVSWGAGVGDRKSRDAQVLRVPPGTRGNVFLVEDVLAVTVEGCHRHLVGRGQDYC